MVHTITVYPDIQLHKVESCQLGPWKLKEQKEENWHSYELLHVESL